MEKEPSKRSEAWRTAKLARNKAASKRRGEKRERAPNADDRPAPGTFKASNGVTLAKHA